MSKSNVTLIVGTRPEVIKMAPIFLEMSHSKNLNPVLLSTGQHRELLDQALGAWGITPDFDLQLMQPGQTLPELTGRVISEVAKFLANHRPDAVLVQGDTTTVLAGAMAAALARVPVGHVEAGLRTYDMGRPFPEEMNRRLVSPLARWSFVPTQVSRQNLLNERIDPSTIHVTGNSVIDALLWMREKVSRRTESTLETMSRLGISGSFAKYFGDSEAVAGPNAAQTLSPISDYRRSSGSGGAGRATPRWILVTGHRRESFGEGFESICESLLEITRRHPNVGVLFPVHLNPSVREPAYRLLSNNSQIALIEPVGYEDFVWLMARCAFLLSDSGGVQEEAPSLGKPVLVTRSTTERPEGIEAGTCTIVGTGKESILREVNILLTDPAEYNRRASLRNPYGDGNTARRIREILERDLGDRG